jgi:hypothetical protein
MAYFIPFPGSFAMPAHTAGPEAGPPPRNLWVAQGMLW